MLRFFQFRVFTAPFHKVGFADFWMADQLNSLASALPDTEYFICYYATHVNWEGWRPYPKKDDGALLDENNK